MKPSFWWGNTNWHHCVFLHSYSLHLKDRQKIWVVLYTRAVYRAVLLEVARSLSTYDFLLTLRRFIARRGRPCVIYSDNGTNFKGANNLFETIDWTEIVKETGIQKIKWKFIPPTAAWWGGYWERLVKVTKELLRRNLGKAFVDLEEFNTLLTEIEGVINQRPLTYVAFFCKTRTKTSPQKFPAFC